MPTYLDILLYEDYLKNKNINNEKKNIFYKKNNFYVKNILNRQKEKNNKENIFFDKKTILDSFVNYPRLELIKKYKIQTYQFLMNKNYRNVFLKFLIVPLSFELCYNIFLRKA